MLNPGERHGPLKGMTVVDFTMWAGGPYCTNMLTDMGADVVKIEPPQGGDPQRHVGHRLKNGETSMYIVYNRGKRSVAVNLKKPEGLAIIHRLIDRADVVVENFRPGTMERLGLGYERLKETNPKLIYCGISGFGRTSSWGNKPGMDPVVQGIGGAMSTTGEFDGPPLYIGVPLADISSGMLAVQGILLAMVHQLRTGEGQRVDVSMIDAVVHFLSSRMAAVFSGSQPSPRMGGHHSLVAPYGIFSTADGYITVGAQDDKRWRQLCQTLGTVDLIEDERFVTMPDRVSRRLELAGLLQEIFLRRTSAEWLATLEEVGILCGPVLGVDEVMRHPVVLENEMVVETHHPQTGPFKVLGVPIKLSGSPGQVQGPAPLLGEHTLAVLKELGYSESEIQVMVSQDVINRTGGNQDH